MHYKTTDTLYCNTDPVHPDKGQQQMPVANIAGDQGSDIVEKDRKEPERNDRPPGFNNFYDTTNVLSS